MPTHNQTIRLTAIIILAVATNLAIAGETGLVSTPGVMAAVPNANGFTIAPVTDIPASIYTEDLAPSQVFEIIRPDMAPITVGRLHSSCTCLKVSMSKREFAAGERALIEVRNVKPTVPDGATYMFFVQMTHPIQDALQYDVFVKSERQPSGPGPASGSTPLNQARQAKPEPHQVHPNPVVPSRGSAGENL